MKGLHIKSKQKIIMTVRKGKKTYKITNVASDKPINKVRL